MKFSISNQLKGELFSLLYGYPHFIYAKNPDFLTNEIPVFVFHTIDPIIFEEQLIFLKDNGYRTLGVNEFVDCLAKKKNTIEKSVLLTVDDGRSSFYRFGYPLLQKYNMRATLFILPGWILDANNVRNNLLEVWKSEINLAQLSAIDPKDETLCTWPEIKEMYASGIVDIENHTLFHKEVFVSPKLVGFIKKNTSFTPYNTPVTAYLGKENINQELTPEKIIGLPLFESAPLLGAHPAIKVPENLIAACKKSYNEFKSDRHPNSDWNKKLKKLVDQYPASSMPCQTKEEMLKDIITDIYLSRSEIQARIDCKAGNHLCLPYGVGSRSAIDVMKKLDIKSCFWGVGTNRKCNTPGSDPLYFVRIKNDFLMRLPGECRQSLSSIYAMKLNLRIRGELVY